MADTPLISSTSRIAVAGISGYAGGELARILLNHPRLSAEQLLFLSRPDETKVQTVSDIHPELTGLPGADASVQAFSWDQLANHDTSVLLLATPHEQSRDWAPIALERQMRVIDLSGAWRLKVDAHREVYGLTDKNPHHATSLQGEAVFGAPELHAAAIGSARLVANPGCYATSIILALAPLLRNNLVDVDHGIIVDAKSGVSGAGKAATAKTHFMYAADNLSAYAVFGHRHTGELLEQLSLSGDQIQFTPHLLPIPRGILSTIYLRLRQPSTPAIIESTLRQFYEGRRMVRVRQAGFLPQIQHVVRTSFCDLGFELGPDGKRLVLISCLDNLLKGAAGQAVQNLNLMLGWGEAEGLV